MHRRRSSLVKSWEVSRPLLLELRKKPEGKRVVILDCAPKTAYQNYYEVVMAIEEAGGVLGMITEPGETASED